MVTKEVVVSGTVGKQVFPVNGSSGRPSLKGFLLASLSAKARVVIREGNASGAVQYQGTCVSGGSLPVILTEEGHRFDRGMHVKVLGTGATCYLYLD
jgi:hypothetical protein